ncbi:MAG: rRNA maturation RNase YbeY [Armatimonadota bacterium]|nr:MAG: rRNA maturation RNase YbeY [Armatimonadota bacterium]
MPEVTVLNEQERPVDCGRLVEFAQSAVQAEARRCGAGWHADAELNVAIGDDAWIQELNRKYRNKDAPTDVLAFPQELGAMKGGPARDAAPTGKGESAASRLLGDVAISAETAARQAGELGHEFEEEIAILLAHGILHLTGWRDGTPAERQQMMRRVEELLAEAQARGPAPHGQDR